MPHHVNIPCKKSFIVKEAEYVYSACKKEGIISIEHVYECEHNRK